MPLFKWLKRSSSSSGASEAPVAEDSRDEGVLLDKKTPDELKSIKKEYEGKLDEMAEIKKRGSRMSDEEAVRLRKELDANNERLEATMLNIIEESELDGFMKERFDYVIKGTFKSVNKFSGNVWDSEGKQIRELERISGEIQKREKAFYEMMMAQADEEMEKFVKCGCIGKK